MHILTAEMAGKAEETDKTEKLKNPVWAYLDFCSRTHCLLRKYTHLYYFIYSSQKSHEEGITLRST